FRASGARLHAFDCAESTVCGSGNATAVEGGLGERGVALPGRSTQPDRAELHPQGRRSAEGGADDVEARGRGRAAGSSRRGVSGGSDGGHSQGRFRARAASTGGGTGDAGRGGDGRG